MFTFFLMPWIMSAMLKAIHTLEVQGGHLRMLRRLKFSKMDKDPEIIEKINTLIALIEENDKPPKIFDTIPLNRVTFNIFGTFFSTGLGIVGYFMIFGGVASVP
jgi:hypothetical protein